jgi:hypothetical protein
MAVQRVVHVCRKKMCAAMADCEREKNQRHRVEGTLADKLEEVERLQVLLKV